MAKRVEPDFVMWTVGKRTYKCQILPQVCQRCKAPTLVGLPEPILKKQPDDTNVVCHPAMGGCNQGFHIDLPNSSLYKWVL